MAQIHVVGLNSSGRFENLGGSNDSGGLITQPNGSASPGLEIQMASGSTGSGLVVSMSGTSSTAADITGDIKITGALGLYTYTAGASITKYDLVYAFNDSGTGKVALAKADAMATSRVVGVAGATASSGSIPIVGAGVYPVVFDSTPVAGDFGKPVYLSSATAARATLTAPSASGTVLVRVGYLVEVSGSATCKISIHVGDTFQQ